MRIEIITPDETLYAGEARLIQMPGYDGSFEVLKNHASLISILKAGKIKIEEEDKNIRYFEIRGGVAEVMKNKILILAD